MDGIVYRNGIINTLITFGQTVHRKFSTIRHQNIILRYINKIYEKVLHCPSEHDLGVSCLKLVTSETEAKFGFIIEIDNENYHVIAETHKDKYTQKVQALCDLILKGGNSLLVNRIVSDRMHNSECSDISTFLGVPFIRDNRVVGIIAIVNRAGRFGAKHKDMLEALAPTVFEAILRKRTEDKILEH